jgi:hypothetical protein
MCEKDAVTVRHHCPSLTTCAVCTFECGFLFGHTLALRQALCVKAKGHRGRCDHMMATADVCIVKALAVDEVPDLLPLELAHFAWTRGSMLACTH